MPDTGDLKLTELPAESSAADTGDLLYLVKMTGDTGVSKSIKVGKLPYLKGDTGNFISDTGRFLSDGTAFVSDTGQFLSDATQFISDTGSFLSDTGKFLSDTGFANSGMDWIYAEEQSTDTGSGVEFSNIPETVSEIEMVLVGVSLSGVDSLLVQIGDTGGFADTGYESGSKSISTTPLSAALVNTTGFVWYQVSALNAASGIMRLHRTGSAALTWACTHTGIIASVLVDGFGVKTLPSRLSRVRLTRTGTNSFDAGVVRLRYR